MIIFLLVLVSSVCLVFLVYPYAIYPKILRLLPNVPVQIGSNGAGDGVRFSVLFCAYNEALSMPAKLENLRALKKRYHNAEFLAFDDGSSDGTADMIENEAPFVRLVRGTGRSGKAHGMKKLASLAAGDFLVFTDANVLLQEDALDVLANCYCDTRVGGVCGALHYLGADGSATAAVGGAYWRLEEQIKDLESKTGSVIGADGSVFSIRRQLYPDFPDTVLDDFTVSMEVVFQGYRLIKNNDVIAYENLVSARSDEFSRKIRIAARAFHTHQLLLPKRRNLDPINKFKYTSHKLLRWFGGAFLMLAGASGIAAATAIQIWLGAILILLAGAILGLGGRSVKGPAASIFDIILAMTATLIGVFKAMQGKTYSTWKPAKSR